MSNFGTGTYGAGTYGAADIPFQPPGTSRFWPTAAYNNANTRITTTKNNGQPMVLTGAGPYDLIEPEAGIAEELLHSGYVARVRV